MQRRLLALLFALLLAAGLAACGSDSDDDASSTGTPTTTAIGGNTPAAGITIENFTFAASPVKPGAKVTVTNDDTTTHSVVSDDADQFGTEGGVPAGSSGTLTAPTSAGSYPFHCGIHPTMKGTLVVE